MIREVWRSNFASELQNMADLVLNHGFDQIFFVSYSYFLFLGHRVCWFHSLRQRSVSLWRTQIKCAEDEGYTARYHPVQQLRNNTWYAHLAIQL